MLRMLNSRPNLPWLCMGDFNDILFIEEKRVGRVSSHGQMQAFRDVLDVCGFVDLGFTGPEFTWQGNRHRHMVWERLYRVLLTMIGWLNILQLLFGIFIALLLIIGQFYSCWIQMVNL